MESKLTYKNHINESVTFGVDGLWFVDTELHNYAWNYISNNGRISNFDRGIAQYSLTVVIACKTAEEGIARANDIVECAEKDILAEKEGQLYWGDYYLKCYLIKSKKKRYIERKGYIEIELTIVSDSPAWTKETSKTFGNSDSEEGKNLDYAYDFPYDFTSPNQVRNLINTGFADVDFKIVVYGEATNPSIYIGNHQYAVNTYVASNEYLTIDSRSKTIYVTRQNGEIVNKFKDRNRDSYIFQKIASGESSITWDGGFSFEITLYEERSEPKWT